MMQKFNNGSLSYKTALKKTVPESFYFEENGCLLLGDSLQVLKRLQNSSVDMIFADPPYSIKKADWDTFKRYGNIIYLWILRDISRYSSSSNEILL